MKMWHYCRAQKIVPINDLLILVQKNHMMFDRSIMINFSKYKRPLKRYLGDSTVALAQGEGKLFLPRLTNNLLSVPAMAQMGAEA